MHKSILLGLGHGINDFISGFLLAVIFFQMDLTNLEKGTAAVLYNLVAFDGQTIVARSTVLIQNSKYSLMLCFVILAFSILLIEHVHLVAILFAGISSAIFHVIGASESLVDKTASKHLGIFLSLGVIGLALGSYTGYLNLSIEWYAIGICIGYSILLQMFLSTNELKTLYNNTDKPSLEKHDIVMILLILIMCFRSFVWDIIILIQQENYKWIICIAAAAALGKMAGGYVSDQVGHLKYTLTVLTFSWILFVFGHNLLWMLYLGAFLLQSTLAPLTIMLIARFKDNKLIAIAWALGLTILFPILFFFSQIQLHPQFALLCISGASICLLAFLYLYDKCTESHKS
mgnify:FL=1